MAEPQGSKEDNSIVGLRTQIFANAVELFPTVVQTAYGTMGVVNADKIFGIATMGHSRLYSEKPDEDLIEHQAILTYGPPTARKEAARSALADTMTQELQNLLRVTAGLLSEAEDLLMDQPPHLAISIYGGGADAALLPTGLEQNLDFRKNCARRWREGRTLEEDK